MNRRGMALVATLWLVVGVAGLCAASLSAARAATWATRNRVWATRARWASKACWSIAQQRYLQAWQLRADSASPPEVARTDLGNGLWCSARWEPDGRRLNLNRADRTALLHLLRRDSLVDALLDWRDRDVVPRTHGAEAEWYRAHGWLQPRNGEFADLAELQRVRGFDAALITRLRPSVTVTDTNPLDLNAADLQVIGLVEGMPAELVDLLGDDRRRGEQAVDLVSLLPRLSEPARRALLAQLGTLEQRFTAHVRSGVLTVTGGLEGTPLESTVCFHLQPSGRRLAVSAVEAQ